MIVYDILHLLLVVLITRQWWHPAAKQVCKIVIRRYFWYAFR